MIPRSLRIVAAIALASGLAARADTFTSAANGNYNANATWGGSAHPANGSADSVTIAGHTVSVLTATDPALDSIGFGNDAAVLELKNNSATTYSLTALDLTGASQSLKVSRVTGGTSFTHILSPGTLTLGGGKTLTVAFGAFTAGQTAGLNLGGTATLTGSEAISVGNNPNGGTGTANLTGIIDGTGSIAKTGAGTLVLSGNNTFSGGVSVSAGTLTLSGANDMTTFSGGVSVSGGTLNLNNAQALGASSLTITGGKLNNSSGGSITLSTATPQYWNSNFAYTGGNNLNLGLGSVLLGDNRQVTVEGASLTVGGVIDDGANTYSLTKAGGYTLALAGANTFGGGVTLSAGTLNINHAQALGTGLFAIGGGTINNGSTGAIVNENNNLQAWNGDFAFAGTQDLDLGTGAVTLGANRQVTASAKTLTVGGVIDDGDDTFNLTKAGTGRLLLNGVNTYGGTTTVSAGRLSIGPSGFVPGTPILSGTGALGLSVAGNLTGGTKVVVGSGTTLTADADIDVSGFVDSSSTGVLGVDFAAYTQNINLATVGTGVMSLGSSGGGTITGGVLTPVGGTYRLGGGGGTLTISTDNYLTGANDLVVNGNVSLNSAQSFTGATTLTAGTLTIGNGNALSSSASVTPNSGTTLHFNNQASTINAFSGTGGTIRGPNSFDLTINQTADGTWAGGITDQRNGQIVKTGAGQLRLTTLDGLQVEYYLRVRAGELRLSDNGRLGNARTCRDLFVDQGASLTFDNVNINQTDRLKVNFGGTGQILLELAGGRLALLGNASANSSEEVAYISDAATGGAFLLNPGANLFDIQAGSGRHAQMTFGGFAGVGAKNAIARNAGSTLVIQGIRLGLAARDLLTADSSSFVFTSPDNSWAPTLTGGIVKGVIAASVATDTTKTFGLCTYDKGVSTAVSTDDVGVRILIDGTENQGTLGAGANVKAGSALTNDGSTINSLHLATGGSITDGGATLTVASGTILSTGAANAIGSASSTDTLAFGATEAVVYNAPASALTVNTKVTGSAGLTKGGDGTLVLANNGASQYTGTTTINGGILSVSGNAALGAVGTGSGVNLNNGGVLQATGTFALDNSGANKRAMVVGGTTGGTITSGGIDVTGIANLTVSGVISGVGKLVKTGTGTLTTAGNNSYSGGTTVSAGKLLMNGTTSNQGDVLVESGATLGGTGTLGLAVGKKLTVANGGTLEIVAGSPLTVTGNLDLSAAGDILAIAGTVTDATVLLTYTGTLTGAFDTVTGLPANYRIDYSTPGQVSLAKQTATVLLLR